MKRSLLILSFGVLAGLGAWGAGLAAPTPEQTAPPAEGSAAPPTGTSDVERLEAESEKAGRVPLTESDC